MPHRIIYTDKYHGVLHRVEQSVQKGKYFNLLEWTFIISSSERVGIGTERKIYGIQSTAPGAPPGSRRTPPFFCDSKAMGDHGLPIKKWDLI